MSAAPVFVKISKYKELSAILAKIQERLDATNKSISDLEALKVEEEKHLQEWREHVETIHTKLETVGLALHHK